MIKRSLWFAGCLWLAALLAGIVLFQTLALLYLSPGDPRWTTNLVLLIVAAGCVLLSLPWLVFVIVTSVAGWFANGLAGIQPDPEAPGFRHFFIRPAPVDDLTWVTCSYRSLRGVIVSNWRREQGRFTLEVTVPANTTSVTQSVLVNGDTLYEPQIVRDVVGPDGKVIRPFEPKVLLDTVAEADSPGSLAARQRTATGARETDGAR